MKMHIPKFSPKFSGLGFLLANIHQTAGDTPRDSFFLST